MYERILVPVENSRWDKVILRHVRELARIHGSELLLIHVADGFVARNVAQLDLRESEEMRADRDYLDACSAELAAEGFKADAILACGDPANEIAAAAERESCDLIAMSTHGHRFLGDLIHGSVASSVRHRSMVPVLLVRGNPEELRA
ncbi:MAG TPA: universal stress protein [Gemmatimonadaceae bacterium]|nr:universal stress protein [Gemmatimonadaceae bacterium]